MVTSETKRNLWRAAKWVVISCLSLAVLATVAVSLMLEFVKPTTGVTPPRVNSTLADAREPDDSTSTATLLEVGAPPQTRTLHSRDDEDWYVVDVVDGDADVIIASESAIGFDWLHENVSDGICSVGLDPVDMANGGYVDMIPYELGRNWEDERIYLKVLNPLPGTVSYRIVARESDPFSDWLADLRSDRESVLEWFASLGDDDGEQEATTPPDYGAVDAAARATLPESFSWMEMEELGLPREAVDTLVAVPYTPPADYRITKSYDPRMPVFPQLERVPADGVVWIAVETSQGARVGDLSLEWTDEGWEYCGSSWGGQDDDELLRTAERKLTGALGGSPDETRVVQAPSGTWLLARRGAVEAGFVTREICHEVDYPTPPNPGPWTGVALRRWFK